MTLIKILRASFYELMDWYPLQRFGEFLEPSRPAHTGTGSCLLATAMGLRNSGDDEVIPGEAAASFFGDSGIIAIVAAAAVVSCCLAAALVLPGGVEAEEAPWQRASRSNCVCICECCVLYNDSEWQAYSFLPSSDMQIHKRKRNV